jgi:uncharacterized protein (UPF0276 family)
MRTPVMPLGRAAAIVLGLACFAVPAGAETTFVANPDVGNNTFTAVFDAAIGERITAVSSAVGCTLTVDEEKLEGRATCSVPLTAIRVDNDDTKSEHFGEWATNKGVAAAQCTFDLEVPAVKLPAPVEPKQPVAFTSEGTFTICGRARDDHGPERIQGTVIYLPAGTYGTKRTLRIRARIDHFDRERYGVIPKHTPGWPAWVSDHLCWGSIGGHYAHDLLPLPYTDEALAHVVARVKRVQDRLGRQILVENVSSYLGFTHSTMPEWEFLAAVAEQADCGILLDVNNVYVSSVNHGFDATAYVLAMPADRVGQIHLAGHSDKGTHIVDTHDDQVVAAVWDLYRLALSRFGPVSTLVEWDDRIPEWEALCAEAERARAVGAEVFGGARARSA